MDAKGKIFFFALRFHPDVVDLSSNDFRHHCYVTLLQRDPESEYEHLSLTHEERIALWSDTTKSAEFGGAVPTSEAHIQQICRSLGWAPRNSAAYYGLCYSAALATTFTDFVDRVAHSLLTNSVSRNELVALFDTSVDPLVNTLMDGLVDLATESAIMFSELTETKLRVAALGREISDLLRKAPVPTSTGAANPIQANIPKIDAVPSIAIPQRKPASKLPVRK